MKKVDGWNEALNALLLASLGKPFAWGQHDCKTLAAEALDVQYGTDFRARAAEAYAGHGETELRALCADSGGIDKVVEDWLGTNVLPINLCERGDIVLYADDDGKPYGLAVHDGQQLVAPGTDGLRRVNMTRGLHGWRPV